MSYEEDIDDLLDTDEHAVEATLDYATTVAVIFDRSYADPLGIAGVRPSALGKATDFADAVGKRLEIGGTAYKVKNVEPQDDGAMVRLQLEEQE